RRVLATLPVGLLAAAAAGWAVAGVAVRPLARLRRIAADLRPDTLSRPIDVGSDTAELTDLQAELDDARRRLDAGYEAQERFVANVSHEVKTPITAILTEAQLLARERDLAPNVRRFVDSTSDEMRRLNRLVESFLLLTRVRHGQPPAGTTRRVSVNDLVMESVEHCGPMADLHGVRLEPELVAGADDDPDLAVRGDPELLCTMLDNLVRNAVRFSPRGDAVRVSVRPGGGDNGDALPGHVSVYVRDRGPGIAPMVLDKLFGTAARREADAPGRGTGLGLEIAQGIAELHGGRVQARNLPDVGCELHVALPLVPANPAA
ncbi:MAG: integral rane sensor signal transduction histidine kinase, partial [Phycisphaerales bacterium]|nr:integral rane sensor signal transduction histidine kinase [Phycisphaerales bacterium]